MKMKQVLLLAVALYVFSTGASYGAFAYFGSTSQSDTQEEEVVVEVDEETGGLVIDPNEAKDQACPLNGAKFTKTEQAVWSKRRPLAIMIENSPDSRPQSGLIRSDVVFEAMAEGGVTRFMALYLCDAVRNDVVVAPVRSARTYYVDWASGFNYPLYVHVGGANLPGKTDALGQLSDYGWTAENDINQFSVGYPTFKRDYNRIKGKEVATEHTMVSSTENLWAVGEERGWTNVDPSGDEWTSGYKGWTFKDGESAGDVNEISFEFWDGFADYAVKWSYDKASNTYKRSLAGEPHTDLETGNQLAVSNAVILFSKEDGPVNELKHMLYQTTGTGKALVFQNGEEFEVNWSKPKRESELAFTDNKGNPFEFVAGKIWISVVDVGTKVNR